MCQNQNVQVDEVASVVTAVINTSTAPRRRRRLAAPTEASTTSSEYEDHLKIDRILYNAFGDMMSIARNTELDWMAHYNDEENYGMSLEDAQNAAIENFLIEFLREKQESFIEMISKLNLSQEMPDPPSDNGNDVREEEQMVRSEPSIVNNPVASDDSGNSSIISIQNIIVPHSFVPARDSPARERSIPHLNERNDMESRAATIHSDPRISSSSRTPPNSKTTTSCESKTAFPTPGIPYDNESQFHLSGSSFRTDIGSIRYSSSSDFSPSGFDDSIFLRPTEIFQFDDFRMNFSQSEQTNIPSPFFPQQSHSNTPPNEMDNSFSSIHFSSQHDGFDAFSTPRSSLKSSSDPQKRRSNPPNLGNIRKNVSRSLTNLRIGSGR